MRAPLRYYSADCHELCCSRVSGGIPGCSPPSVAQASMKPTRAGHLYFFRGSPRNGSAPARSLWFVEADLVIDLSNKLLHAQSGSPVSTVIALPGPTEPSASAGR